VGRMDLKPGVHEVEQSRCVDHVSSHGLSLTGPVWLERGSSSRNVVAWGRRRTYVGY
jgi:hypothetical protein